MTSALEEGVFRREAGVREPVVLVPAGEVVVPVRGLDLGGKVGGDALAELHRELGADE